jgi:hypothetical protein
MNPPMTSAASDQVISTGAGARKGMDQAGTEL